MKSPLKEFFKPRMRKILLALIFLFIFYLLASPSEEYWLAIVFFILFYVISCVIVYTIRSVHE